MGCKATIGLPPPLLCRGEAYGGGATEGSGGRRLVTGLASVLVVAAAASKIAPLAAPTAGAWAATDVRSLLENKSLALAAVEDRCCCCCC